MEVIGIMQPYFFPYIGYFQLITSVDKFVIYDDVNFIKQGWINRNKILINKKPFLFTVPLENASSFNLINETYLNSNMFHIWVQKFIKTIEQSYNKAPYYNITLELIKEVLSQQCETISELAVKSITEVSKYLNIKTVFIESSTIYNNNDLRSQERVLDICVKENAKQYINPMGGMELYTKDEFNKYGLTLKFLKPNIINYEQNNKGEFVPWLSIIDIMMFNSNPEIQLLLKEYSLE